MLHVTSHGSSHDAVVPGAGLAAPGGADPVPSAPWASHEGPWWRPQEVLLMVSEPAKGGFRYRPVHRVPLAGE